MKIVAVRIQVPGQRGLRLFVRFMIKLIMNNYEGPFLLQPRARPKHDMHLKNDCENIDEIQKLKDRKEQHLIDLLPVYHDGVVRHGDYVRLAEDELLNGF